jgi:hypothetical protein
MDAVTSRQAFDVAVVGGGSAGVAAALAASDSGARTLLIERCKQLGGNVSQAHVHTICGLFHSAGPAEDASPPRHAHEGFTRRFSDELVRAGAARAPERAGQVWVLPLSPPHYEAQLQTRVEAAAPALTTWTGAELLRAELGADEASSSQLLLRHRGEERSVEASVVIDTSGDGVLVSRGGAAGDRAAPAQLQRASFIFRLRGVASGALEGFARMRLTATIAGAERSGVLPPGCESVLARPGASGEAYVTVNIPPLENQPYLPQEEACRMEMETRGRGFAEAITELLRERYEAFSNARIDAFPRRLGVREGTRLLGRSIVDADDILCGRRREDEVALSTWPIELWHDHRRAQMRYPSAAAGIPLGALVSRSHPKLGMAGRCLSASHEALGALRVLGTALASGDAIGRAAALASASGRSLWQIEASEVRNATRGVQA